MGILTQYAFSNERCKGAKLRTAFRENMPLEMKAIFCTVPWKFIGSIQTSQLEIMGY